MEKSPEGWVIKKGLVYDLKTNSKVYTPITMKRMERWIAEGRVKKDHLVWRSGLSGWRRAGDLKELKPLFGKALKGSRKSPNELLQDFSFVSGSKQ